MNGGKKEDHRTKAQLLEEIEELRRRLEEAEQTLEAIRTGDVDALVVVAPQGEQVYTLTGAEHVYRVIVETMNEAALTVDANGTILFCNQRFCDLMKASMHEVLGCRVTTFVARPQQLPLQRLLADVQAGPAQRRVTLRATDGAAVPVQISASLLPANAGISICLVASDLTELEASANSIRVLREHQQALEESESRFRAIFESSQDAIVITNDEGIYVQANPAVATIFGVPPEKLIGRRISDFVGSHIDVTSAWREFRATGSFHGEMPLTGADGQVRYVDSYAVANILPGRHLSVVRDITERKRAQEALQEVNEQLRAQAEELQSQAEELRVANEELRLNEQALRESEEHYHRLFEDDLTGNFISTPDGQILLCNPAFARTFGFSRAQDAVGTNMRDLYLDPQEREPLLERLKQEGKIERLEAWRKRRDGEPIYVVENLVGLFNERGELYEIKGYIFDDTERKRAEEALRESRERLERAQEIAHLGSWEMDLVNNRLTWSDEVYRIFGLQPREFDATYEAFLDHVHSEDRAAVDTAYFGSVREGRDTYEIEHRIVRSPTGEVRIVHEKCEHMRDAAGRIIRSVGMVHDITERKQAEQALRESEEKFRTLHALSPIGIVLNRLDNGQFLESNQALWEMTGYTEEEFRSLTYWDITPSEYREMEARQLELLHTVGRYGPYEKEYIRKDGSRFPVLLSGVRLQDPSGTEVIYSVIQDITELIAKEQALRESEEKYRTLFSSMDQGFCIIEMIFDADGRPADYRFLEINPAFERQTGLHEARGKLMRELAPDHEAHWFEIYGKIALTGEPERFVNEAKALGRWYDVYAFRVGEPQSGHVAILFNDITERRRAEEQLREFTRTLETRVAERTAELQHRARQLQKLALDLSEAEEQERKRLAEILHDDLQQQLAAAKFHVQMLSNRLRHDPMQREIAAKVDQMLKEAVEKSRSLSHELSPAVLYHGNLVETFNWLAGQIQAKHGLVVHVDAFSEVVVHSDALKAFLYKAGQELLFNVVKHARVGEARIRMRRVGRCICLSVSDHGRGFDPQELRQTTGFGLFSIRERVELLGGRMKIKSARGQGSTFHIVVPDDGAPLAARPSSLTITDRRATSDEPPPLRVLLADDHQIVREGLASLLAETPGIEVVGEAANGREAINQASRLRPDVVIMDVTMPLINGDEATRQIKMHLPGTRVVALSMYDDADLIEKMRQAGAEGYILKTAPSEELLAAIRGR